MSASLLARSCQVPTRNLLSKQAIPAMSRSFVTAGSDLSYKVDNVNGIKVVTVEDSGSNLTSLGVFTKAGSRYETLETQGASHFLRSMAFKNTKNKLGVSLVRDLQGISPDVAAYSDRERFGVVGHCLRKDGETMLDLVTDVLQPAFKEWEVRDERGKVLEEAQAAEKDINVQVEEALHREAFRGQGVGRGAYCPVHKVNSVDGEVLHEFVRMNYNLEGTTVVAVGVSHEAFVNKVGKALSFLPKSKGDSGESSKYQGGFHMRPFGGPSQVVVAMEGVSSDSPDLAVSHVFAAYLGSGTNVSKEATPGTGVTSPLSSWVREKPWLFHSASSFNLNYAGAGLCGVRAVGQASGSPDQPIPSAQNLLKDINDALAKVASGPISRADFERSVNIAKLRAYPVSRSSLVTAALGVPSSSSVNHLADAISSVTPEQLSAFAKKAFDSRRTVIAFGDVTGVDFPVA